MFTENAKWIWIKTEYDKDVYAEFSDSFKCENGAQMSLKIACDGIYTVFVNGNIAAFSACADYPTYKLYDEVDITEFCKEYNQIKIVVWHLGENSQSIWEKKSLGF